MPAPATILIVEDESIIALDLHETLSGLGYQILATVASGEEALLLLETAIPDLVLMDIRLSGAMSGLDAALQIRARFGVPALFLTSHTDRHLIEKAKECDALGYLLKPFNDRSLAIHVEMAVHRARRERTPLTNDPAASPCRESTVTIRTLGQFEIVCGPQTLYREDFSRSQRELIALILSSPRSRITREEVELCLWPDSPPLRARSSFDSLLLRLRKSLRIALCHEHIKGYLVFQKGVLTLEHCQVDAYCFLRQIREGLQLVKKATLDATEQLRMALAHWHGTFMPGVGGGDRVEIFRLELCRAYVDGCRQLAALLVEGNQFEEGISWLKQSLLIDPVNDELVGELYRLLVRTGHLAQARQLLRQHVVLLQDESFSRSEILSAVRDITGTSEDFSW